MTRALAPSQIRPFAIALAAVLLGLPALLRSLDRSPDPRPIRQPARFNIPVEEPAEQAFGRCELFSFSSGNLVAKNNNRIGERDCLTRCALWLSARPSDDASCSWNGREFERQTAPPTVPEGSVADDPTLTPPAPAPAPAASARQIPGLRDDGLVDDPDPAGRAKIIKDELPDIDERVPLQARRAFVGERIELEFDFVPKIWVGDSRLVLVEPGAGRRQVRVHLLSAGVSDIVVTDQIDQPVKKIIFNIDPHR